MAATRFHLMRHAQTDSVGRVLAGRGGPGLNVHGLAEADQAAQMFAGRPVKAVFSSPQMRAQQTAAAIGAVLEQPFETEAALDEVEFGPWTGRTFEALEAEPAWRDWNTTRSMAAGGETMLAVQARAVGLLQRLHHAWPDGDLVLVSHADVLRSLLAYLLGVPIDLMQRIELAPASRSVAVLAGGDVRIEALNLLP